MNSKERNFLRKKAHSLEPVVRVGKEGLTDGILDSIKTYINKNELMKVKLLPNSLEDVNKELILEIENKTGAIFIASVGHIIILFKEKKLNGKLGEITKEFYDFKKDRGNK